MTGFDILVLVVVGLAATFGFLRGFVQEAISLFAGAVAIFAIHMLHTPLAQVLTPHIGTESGASVLAFFLLLIVPYVLVRAVARYLGTASRASALAPVDRVLGFGFGAVKGTLIIVLGYSVLILGYDTIWGPKGRPGWITHSRTYNFIDASSEALVKMISQRRRDAADERAKDEAEPDAKPTTHARRKTHRAVD
jgi:membrane protein required for colicin V production